MSINISAITQTGAVIPGLGRSSQRLEASFTSGQVSSFILTGGFGDVGQTHNDYFRGVLSGNNVAITALTRAGATPTGNLESHPVIGDASGILFYNNAGTFYRGVPSGNTITITSLARNGAAVPSVRGAEGIGTTSSGMILGGFGGGTSTFLAYYYTMSANTIFITQMTLTGNVPGVLSYHRVVGNVNSGMLCMGGTSAGGGLNNNFYRYTRTGTTLALQLLTKTGTGAGLAARSGFGLTGDANTGLLFGGHTGGSTTLNDFYKYEVEGNNIELETLTQQGGTIPRRAYFDAVGDSNEMLVWSGWNGSNRPDDWWYAQLPTPSGQIRRGTGANFVHIFHGTRPISSVKRGSADIWMNTDTPDILTFTATPSPIDRDTRATGNISLSWTAAAKTAAQTANVYLEPQGTQVGQSYVTAANAGVSETFTTPQPTQTQAYRLVIRTAGGASHRDASIVVTQNAAISNFRRTAFQQNPGTLSGTFWFAATITGTPQPTLSYRFGNGRQGAITARHLTSSGTNQWTLNWNIFHSVLNDSLVLTATNSSNTTTATIANISS